MGDYYEIAANHVDPAARHVAHQTLIVACRDLGITDADRPAVRWFSEPSAADRAYIRRYGEHVAERLEAGGPGVLEGRSIRGENVVWLRSSAPLESLAETVAHELAHLVIGRQRGGGWTASERARQEAAADAYGQRYQLEDRP